MNIENLIARLDELMRHYHDEIEASKEEGRPGSYTLIANRLEAAIDQIAPPGSTYIQQLDRERGFSPTSKVFALYKIAEGLREDLKSGWGASAFELAHAETHGDYLEMAEALLVAGYKDAAAVITGTTLEVHVRTLCVKYGVDTDQPNGSPKKADTMNADLKKAGVYDGLQQKQITAWMALRNNAAHGDYTSYDASLVRLFVEGVRAFVSKHPA